MLGTYDVPSNESGTLQMQPDLDLATLQDPTTYVEVILEVWNGSFYVPRSSFTVQGNAASTTLPKAKINVGTFAGKRLRATLNLPNLVTAGLKMGKL